MSEPMDLIYKDPKYPSSKVVNGLSMAGPRAICGAWVWSTRSWPSRLSASSIPITRCIPGIIHLNRIGQLVKDGVREAGASPLR